MPVSLTHLLCSSCTVAHPCRTRYIETPEALPSRYWSIGPCQTRAVQAGNRSRRPARPLPMETGSPTVRRTLLIRIRSGRCPGDGCGVVPPSARSGRTSLPPVIEEQPGHEHCVQDGWTRELTLPTSGSNRENVQQGGMHAPPVRTVVRWLSSQSDVSVHPPTMSRPCQLSLPSKPDEFIHQRPCWSDHHGRAPRQPGYKSSG